MKYDCIDKVITDFYITGYASKEDVMYAATHYRNSEISNESAITPNDFDFLMIKSIRYFQEKITGKLRYLSL